MQGSIGPVAGDDTQIIFNDNGVSGADSSLTYDKLTKTLIVGGYGLASITPGIGINSTTVFGPTEIIIDPTPKDDNGGIVRIKGDLYVDGTQTYLKTATIETLSELNVSGLSTFGNTVELNSGLKDFYNNVGVAGSILISTGAGVSWTDPYAAGLQGLQGLQGISGLSIQGAQGPAGGGGGGGGSIAIADTSTNDTFYVGIASTTTGDLTTLNVSTTGLTFNPSTGNLIAGGTVTANSDEKLKTNIKTIENALDKVLSLRGVEYDRIDNGDHQIGVIAQEVENIIPHVVYPKKPSPNYETKSVAYANLIGLLIEAVKELNKKIEEK